MAKIRGYSIRQKHYDPPPTHRADFPSQGVQRVHQAAIRQPTIPELDRHPFRRLRGRLVQRLVQCDHRGGDVGAGLPSAHPFFGLSAPLVRLAPWSLLGSGRK
jgi:hypothetical protein